MFATMPAVVAWVAIGAVGLSLFAIVAILLLGGHDSAVPTLEDHFNSYGPRGVLPTHREDVPKESLADQAREAARRALARNRGLEAAISARLDAAGSNFKAPEWLIIHGAITIIAGFVCLIIARGNVLGLLIGLVLGGLGPWLYLGIKRDRRLRAFESNLAETLQLMSGSLTAGLSLQQSIDTVVKEGADPIASEFRRAVVEMRLGVELEDALAGVASRMGSKDFSWVVMAVGIQRKVGGNLAELLLTVAATLREREQLRRHVKALSAEGRLSCWVLGGLPPVFMLYLAMTRPAYMKPLFHTSLGVTMVVAMVILLVGGIFWMSKLVKVEL